MADNHESEPRPDREAVARIIDPEAWRIVDGHASYVVRHTIPLEPRRVESLAKADAILALLPTEPVQEMREGWRVETLHDIDPPRGAWDWIEGVAKATEPPQQRLETPKDAETIVFWHNEKPVAFVLNIRDQFNRSVQFRASLLPSEDGWREELAKIDFPYQATFNAIGDAVTLEGSHIAISVAKFQASIRAALSEPQEQERQT